MVKVKSIEEVDVLSEEFSEIKTLRQRLKSLELENLELKNKVVATTKNANSPIRAKTSSLAESSWIQTQKHNETKRNAKIVPPDLVCSIHPFRETKQK